MLKRKDLAKDFEKIVQQEIINHNKAVFESNQRINTFEEHLNFLEKALKLSDGKSDSKIGEIYHEIEKAHLKLLDLINEIKKAQRDNAHKFLAFAQDHEKSQAKIYGVLETKESSKFAINQLQMQIDEINRSISTLSSSMGHQIEQIAAKELEKRKAFEEQMRVEPKAIEVMRKECKSAIEAYRLDNEGLLKEVQRVKKDAFIQEKKIENLYTLIERLTKKIAPGG